MYACVCMYVYVGYVCMRVCLRMCMCVCSCAYTRGCVLMRAADMAIIEPKRQKKIYIYGTPFGYRMVVL